MGERFGFYNSLVKPGFLKWQADVVRGGGPLPGFRLHDDPHAVVGNLVWVKPGHRLHFMSMKHKKGFRLMHLKLGYLSVAGPPPPW